ncbi:la-related protein 7-like [Diadema setosum]|uniref:la-related protein 7-like n=1 Tax=Diadema setosum TaxID=31175 RepID=UPI003B3A7E5A
MYTEKRPRKRLKKLTVDICQQVEFYFSDANLRKDRYLMQEMSKTEKGYVSLDVLANFNKMKSMTQDRKVIVAAIQQSSLLELSDDETSVRRKKPLEPPKHDPDDCTVYVENLPKKVNHDWLRKTFSYCGNVVYTSLPRYKSTGDSKGFAFVEFDHPEEASRACEILNNPPPDMLCSAGQFPKTRGRRRIMPLEFARGNKKEQTKKEAYEDSKVSLKPGHGVALSRSSEPSKDGSTLSGDGGGGKQKRKIDAGEADGRSERKLKSIKGDPGDENAKDACLPGTEARSKITDRQRDVPIDSTKCHSRKADSAGHTSMENEGTKMGTIKRETNVTASSEGSRSKQIPDSRRADKDAEEAEEKRRGQKRRHTDVEKTTTMPGGEEISVHAKSRKESGEDGEKVTQEQKEKAEKDIEPLKVRQAEQIAASRKIMKRKRSLSEGDLFDMRLIPSDSVSRGRKTLAEKALKADAKELPSKKSSLEEIEKKKRIRRKKTKQLQEEDESLFLRVISKHEWLELRKEYLALQKECLSTMKQSLRDQSTGKRQSFLENKTREQVPHHQADSQQKEQSAQIKSSELDFVEGTVVKIHCHKSETTRKEIREYVDKISPVAYIDLPDGESQGYIRFKSAEGPSSVLQGSKTGDLKDLQISMSLIEGDEEKGYWERLKLDRFNKLNSKEKRKKNRKARGVNKLLQKAEQVTSKASSHIRFDD